MLDLLMREDGFPEIWMPSSEQRDLRTLLRDRHQWVKMRTRVTSLRQLFHSSQNCLVPNAVSTSTLCVVIMACGLVVDVQFSGIQPSRGTRIVLCTNVTAGIGSCKGFLALPGPVWTYAVKRQTKVYYAAVLNPATLTP
jgi:hypothetical protein